jgi:glutathione S-transferase
MHRLITIPFSHYNEKARWALTRFGVPYRESAYLPLFHMAPVALATWKNPAARADKVSTRFSTPVLVKPNGETVCDSCDIVEYVDREFGGGTLYPSAEVHALEDEFHDHLGPHTRRVAYHYSLKDPALIRETARKNVGATQSMLFSLAMPAAARILRKGLSITDERSARSREKILEQVESVSQRLTGRRYLIGDTFTAADLAFACMLAPVLGITRKEGYGADLPEPNRLAAEARDLAHAIRKTRAGEHALRMFREEKQPKI